MIRRLATRGVFVLAAFAFVEISLRLLGAVDFPLYKADGEIGYSVAPSQRGSFLVTHTWVYNNRSMGTALDWAPSEKPNILLIGNSIVMGGNPYSQPEKLGPLIAAYIGNGLHLWPIAVGGWTEVNESAYLERNPDIVGAADFFVWIVLSGGLGELSQWRDAFPTEHPICASCYVARRYVLPRLTRAAPVNDLPPTDEPTGINIERFGKSVAALSGATRRVVPGVLLLYPRRAELRDATNGKEWVRERAVFEHLAEKHNLRLIDLANRSEWADGLYRDDTHPTPEGNRVLGKIIADAVREGRTTSR